MMPTHMIYSSLTDGIHRLQTLTAARGLGLHNFPAQVLPNSEHMLGSPCMWVSSGGIVSLPAAKMQPSLHHCMARAGLPFRFGPYKLAMKLATPPVQRD